MGYRYIGSKTKILDKVLEAICSLAPKGSHVVDLMCGTAAVSSALRRNGFHVTAVDIMTFSYHHARVALLLNEPPEFANAVQFIERFFNQSQQSLFPLNSYERVLLALNNLPPIEGYFWREFSIEGKPKNTKKPRNYFTPENARLIDAIRFWIKKLKQMGDITDLEHSLLLHDLILAANDVANIAGTYGHYLSKTVDRARLPLRLKPTTFHPTDSCNHTVLKGYAEDLSENISCDICYIDPPYMKRQYAANYHILETLAREDEPEAIGVSGLRPWRDQYSNFCTKTKIRSSFKKILTKMKCRDFLVSYSEDGLLKIEEMLGFFSEFGKTEVSSLMNKRFRSNESPLTADVTEYIIHLRIDK